MLTEKELIEQVRDALKNVDGDEKNLFRANKLAALIKEIVTRWGNWKRKTNNADIVLAAQREREENESLLIAYVIKHMNRDYSQAVDYIERLRFGVDLSDKEKKDKATLIVCSNMLKIKSE